MAGLYTDFEPLCGYYKEFFKIGTALNADAYTKSSAEGKIAARHFNLAVAENDTKMERVFIADNSYDFSAADAYLSFAARNAMEPRWHTFVWHNQSPEWIFSDADGRPVSRQLLQKRVRTYIQTVTEHCQGAVHSYDVVNEVISDKTGKLRTAADHSRWLELMGDDYIENAFRWAHEADSSAELVINDYNIESKKNKRDGLYAFVQSLLAKKVPVTAVGLQMHISVDEPDIHEIEDTISLFGSLGLKVLVTEMDVSAYNETEQECKAYTPALLQKQAERYVALFECFRRASQKGFLDKVLLWGVTDQTSWKNNFPVPGRTDIPLLFNADGSVKPAFTALIKSR